MGKQSAYVLTARDGDGETGGDPEDVLREAADTLASLSREQTDGVWLEHLTADVAPLISDWNLGNCWRWQDWPDRDDVMPPGTPTTDVGIDLVARRGDDGGWIAIQAKARQLDDSGEGAPINSPEMNKFLGAAADKDIWAERWVAVNGDVRLAGHSPGKVAMSGAPVKVVNVAHAVEAQRAALAARTESEPCPHCDGAVASGRDPSDGDAPPAQTRSCMQREAVNAAVERLRENEQADEPSIPRGEARGRIVLPCGAGKTRIALRIVESLTYAGEFSVVLCPSIALVAQIRREFLEHTVKALRVMAVCSDQGVAADEEKVANDDDATLDRGMETVDAIKGCPVTTDPAEIAWWIRGRRDGRAANSISVIFGTYQSAGRIAEGIAQADAADGFKVLICDEAHRTAGVRRRKRSTAADERLRDFTLCHDREAFPAAYRIYQTATPRIYGDSAMAEATGRPKDADWVVRHMDDQAVFGVELYRRSYADAVRNRWLSDYKIIAMGVGDQEALDIANLLVLEADQKAADEAAAASSRSGSGTTIRRTKRSERLPTTGDYLKGMAFALAIGGGAITNDGRPVPIKSCIGFLNTIARSRAMTDVLQSKAVKSWVASHAEGAAPDYTLEHLDASSPVAKRDEAKLRLASAAADDPHGILNVGIFGEGTDSPSLSAVAFLEPRKSPIDVVQAVGRAMRRAQGKELGYIIVPVVIPPGEDAERYLAISDKHEGWRELGDILQALRAHDRRIEDALPEILTIQVPSEQPPLLELKTVVAVGRPDRKNLEYAVVIGSRDEAEDVARAAVKQERPLLDFDGAEKFDQTLWAELKDQPTSMIVHVERPDGSTETREDSVVRHKPKSSQEQGDVNEQQTRRRAGKMANGERGRSLPDPAERARMRAEREQKRQEREAERRHRFETHIQGVLVDLSDRMGGAIAMNLLEKSGLTGNKVKRDLNLLRGAVTAAARDVHDESGLAAALDEHFGLDRLSAPKQDKPRADGATVASLLWMNAAMLHQRVHAGGWLGRRGIEPLAAIKASPEPDELFRESWNAITRQDFLPVLEPALEALAAARRSSRLGGLRRALRRIAEEAELIAETYADMGTDHAGALFNEVMGDQSSDGAFFTRPIAADIAARLAWEAVDPGNELDWSDPNVWRNHKTVDLACGSGTLLTAAMAEMKRRARLCGADDEQLAALQKVAVEEVLKGLDVNMVSLQLAATQLMSGNTDVKYRGMGLHLMPYGPQEDGTVAAGSPELLGRRAITNALRLFDDEDGSVVIETGADHDSALEGPEMDDAAAAVSQARVIIMNPPFTKRTKMGEKFDKDTQHALRRRMDTLEGYMASADGDLSQILDKNYLEPMFTALADLCLDRQRGVFSIIVPTTALTATSSRQKRVELARRFHVHTILTCHQARDEGLSQGSEISESIVVLQRATSQSSPPTRVVSLDRLPSDATETDELFAALGECTAGTLDDGWGEVSHQPAERVAGGDWTAAMWRSPILADAAALFAFTSALPQAQTAGLSGHSTGRQLSNGYAPSVAGQEGAFPILFSKSVDVQKKIEGFPDAHWVWRGAGPAPILSKAGHLFVTTGQYMPSARLMALATQEAYVGRGWTPVTGGTAHQAQALALFINSTIGRLVLMRLGGQFLHWPSYKVAAVNSLPLPDIANEQVVAELAGCWAETKSEEVPPFSDGYTDIRRRWDASVCRALNWDISEITDLGDLLAHEPRVRGTAYGQWRA